jgi:hypothetical protein
MDLKNFDNGFAKADGLKGKSLQIPDEFILLTEFPGSTAGVPGDPAMGMSRIFTAAPARLEANRELEMSKVILEVQEPYLIPHLPPVLEQGVKATLRYVGNGASKFTYWKVQSVERGYRSIRITIRPNSYYGRDGTRYRCDWVCSAVSSTTIDRIQEPEQRIRVRP